MVKSGERSSTCPPSSAQERKRDRERAWRTANPEKAAARALAYNERNRERNRERGRVWYQKNHEVIKAKAILARASRRAKGLVSHARAWRLRKYGLTAETYKALEDAQGGVCAVCAESTSLHIDHCHATGKVRGLLCQRCNTAIGLLRDQSAIVARAAAYLASAG